MERITISISDDLMDDIDTFRRREGSAEELEAVVEDALRRFFSEANSWGGRDYRPPSGPLRTKRCSYET